jgi:hypothetical protein
MLGGSEILWRIILLFSLVVGLGAQTAVASARDVIAERLPRVVQDSLSPEAADEIAWNDPVTVDQGFGVGKQSSLEIVNGYPAASYYDYTNGNLKYLRAKDDGGTAWDASLVLDANGDVGVLNTLAVVNSNPAISYFDLTNNKLKYISAKEPGNFEYSKLLIRPIRLVDTICW